ncbi:helix-turn-helix domain-containing protein [Humibacter antri]
MFPHTLFGMAGVRADSKRGGGSGDSRRPADGFLWDVSSPSRPISLPGVRAAGFTDRGLTPPQLRLIPHPALTLILVFDGSISVENEAGQRLRGSLVLAPGFGQVLRSAQLQTFGCLQLRLSPPVARAVLGGVAAEIDGVLELEDLWGRHAAGLIDELAGHTSWASRFALTERWLIERLSAGGPMTPEIAWAWKRVTQSRGTIRIEQLAADLGWSRRRLWERFRSEVGMTPKRATKLVRFDHAVHRLAVGQPPASVAAEVGFSDQSHLHRDVAAFTGRTPSTVGAEPFLAVDGIAWGWPGRASGGRDSNR